MNIYFLVSSFYFLLIFGVYGICFLVDKDIVSNINFLTQASDEAGLIFFNLGLLFSLGAFLGGRFGSKKYKQEIFSNRNAVENKKFKFELKSLGRFLCIFNIYAVLILFYIGGYDLISRGHYRVDFGDEALMFFLSYFEMLVGFFPVLGIFFWNNSKKAKLYGLVSISLSVVYLFAVGTKFSAIALLLYLIASYYRDRDLSFLKVCLFVLVPILFVLVLFQRLIGEYGLATISNGLSVFVNSGEEAINLALEVIISPVYITAESLVLRRADWTTFLVEINPLPGNLIGWYSLAEAERINYAVPFNALGTLAAYSYSLVLIYGALSSIAVSLFESSLRAFIGVYAKAGALAISFLHLGLVYQYNFRSSFRWIYYCLAGFVIFYVWKVITNRKKFSHGSRV